MAKCKHFDGYATFLEMDQNLFPYFEVFLKHGYPKPLLLPLISNNLDDFKGYPHLGNIQGIPMYGPVTGHRGTAIKVALATQGMRKHKNPGEGRREKTWESKWAP